MYSEQDKQDARKAADLLRARGWCQNTSVDRQGRCCAMMAVQEVAHPRYGHMRALIGEIVGRDSVTAWNDEEGRTKEEVLAVFDRIANS